MSKRTRGRRDSSPLFDSEFAAALEEEDAQHRGGVRRQEHKTRQFCAQVERALNSSLAERLHGDLLDGVCVEEVLPAPGCGHLIACIVIPDERSADGVLAELRACTPRLRAELTRSISRKRVPELSFVAATVGGDSHE